MEIGLLGSVRSPEALQVDLEAVLQPGTALSTWPSRIGLFPATPVERALQAIGHLDAGIAAAQAGADAVVIDSVADYGLDALRSALAIPVVGSGEAGMAAAARHGRFAIVTVWPKSMNFAPRDLLRAYNLADRCIGIHNVADEHVVEQAGEPARYLGRVNGSSPEIVNQVVLAIETAASAGAQAILLGCTCMSPMSQRVADAVRLPVINPLAEGVRAAAALAGSNAARGVVTERGGLIREMVAAVAGKADESCPVCPASNVELAPL